MSAHHVIGGRPAALVGDMREPDAGHLRQHLAGEVMRRGGAGGAVGQLVRIFLRIIDQLGDRFHRHARMHDQHDDIEADVDHRRKILGRIERRRLVEMHVAGERGVVRHHQRIAVSRLARDMGGGEIAAAAGAVLHHIGLAEFRLQRVAHRAGDEVGGGAGRVAGDDGDGAAGIGLRGGGNRHQRDERECCSEPAQGQRNEHDACLLADARDIARWMIALASMLRGAPRPVNRPRIPARAKKPAGRKAAAGFLQKRIVSRGDPSLAGLAATYSSKS